MYRWKGYVCVVLDNKQQRNEEPFNHVQRMAGQRIDESVQAPAQDGPSIALTDDAFLKYLLAGSVFAVCILFIDTLTSGEWVSTTVPTTGTDVFGTVAVVTTVFPVGLLILIGAAAVFSVDRYQLYSPLVGSAVFVLLITLAPITGEFSSGIVFVTPLFLLSIAVVEYHLRRVFTAEQSSLVVKITGIVTLYTAYVGGTVLWPLVGRQTPWFFQLTPYTLFGSLWFLFGLYFAVIGFSLLLANKWKVYMPLCIGFLWVLFELTYLHTRVGAGDFAVLIYVFCGPLVAVMTVGAGVIEQHIRTMIRRYALI